MESSPDLKFPDDFPFIDNLKGMLSFSTTQSVVYDVVERRGDTSYGEAFRSVGYLAVFINCSDNVPCHVKCLLDHEPIMVDKLKECLEELFSSIGLPRGTGMIAAFAFRPSDYEEIRTIDIPGVLTEDMGKKGTF